MKKLFIFVLISAVLTFGLSIHNAEARARYGSHRIGGYNSHGKGSHYIGGYVRSCHGWACR
ncbi:MAG: hypothetical protein NTY12_05510 [Candidatus Falkowbacteria bacterium]|nr:hypothetical protein [Candidatus Falkowbacteria bacterium]